MLNNLYMTRRNMLAAAAGVAAVGATAGMVTAAYADEAPVASTDSAKEGTRYTKATNTDEIGYMHEASATEDADVVVVGSGISGIVCAMIAAEQAPDAKIIIVEAHGYCGGGTNFAEQADMPMPGKSLVEALQYGEAAAEDTVFVKDGGLIAELNYELGRNSAWMFAKHGVPLKIKSFDRLQSYIDGETDLKIARYAGYMGGNGSATIQFFVDEIDSDPTYANVEIRTSTRGICLIVSDDEYTVTGIQVKNADGAYTNINAKSVVLSCGGMSNNLELLQNYSNQELTHCISVDQGHFGDGMVMAEWTAHGRCKTIALSSMEACIDGFDYQSWLALAAGEQQSALMVNQTGERFCDESTPNISVHFGVGRSKIVEGQGRVYSIMGQNLFNFYKENGLFNPEGFYSDGQAERPYDLDADLEEHLDNPNVFVADTLEELAEMIDVPVDTFVETVNQYDADAEAGQGDTLFLKDAEYMIPLGDAPYYAFHLCSIIVNTNAGIRVNKNCQVVDQDQNPVKGLYASGIGISGFVTDIYETGNCQCVSIWSGSKAARTLVEEDLGGTVDEHWYGESEWQAGDLPNFVNWDEYEEYAAGLDEE